MSNQSKCTSELLNSKKLQASGDRMPGRGKMASERRSHRRGKAVRSALGRHDRVRSINYRVQEATGRLKEAWLAGMDSKVFCQKLPKIEW
jgi:hypothetical protein